MTDDVPGAVPADMTSADEIAGILEWSDPPPARRGTAPRGPGRSWQVTAKRLKSRPGKNAKVSDDADVSLVPRINTGYGHWSPRGAFVAQQRMIDGKRHVWARYVGSDEVGSDEVGSDEVGSDEVGSDDVKPDG